MFDVLILPDQWLPSSLGKLDSQNSLQSATVAVVADLVVVNKMSLCLWLLLFSCFTLFTERKQVTSSTICTWCCCGGFDGCCHCFVVILLLFVVVAIVLFLPP